uniref:tail fiber assembly protein n=1 Tax=Atlantibacter hermannii TaxID=565 RepID=UPI002FDCF946
AEVFSEFFSELPPAGKMRAAGPDGLPSWADIPKPSKEELINQAEQQRTALKAEADAQIAWRQDAVEVGIATEEEKSILAEWKKYRVLLMRIDTSKGPDIIWPPTP